MNSNTLIHPCNRTDEEKIALIADRFRDIMIALGLDVTDESLERTPYRVAKMYVNEIFSGLKEENFPEVRFVKNREAPNDRSRMVTVSAPFTSFCEHHFVPMSGTARIAYIPNKKLIGLSKIPRLVRHFALRPQLQERLTGQISDCLAELLETENVAVYIKAQHYCMIARGIENSASFTETHSLRGLFEEDPSLQNIFLKN